MVILYISIFLFLGYSCLIIYYWLSWRAVPEYISGVEKQIRDSQLLSLRGMRKKI